MFDLTNNPVFAITLAFFRTRLEPLRARSDRGASAIEWAVIAGICVVFAIAIGTAIRLVITAGTNNINQGVTTP